MAIDPELLARLMIAEISATEELIRARSKLSEAHREHRRAAKARDEARQAKAAAMKGASPEEIHAAGNLAAILAGRAVLQAETDAAALFRRGRELIDGGRR